MRQSLAINLKDIDISDLLATLPSNASLRQAFIARGWPAADTNNFVNMAKDDSDSDSDSGGGGKGGKSGASDDDSGDDDDDDTDDDDDDDDDDDSDDDDDDDSSDDDKSGKGKKDDKGDPRIKELSDENARWRNKFKAEKSKREEMEQRLSALEGKDKKPDEKLQEENDKLKADNDRLAQRVNKAAIRDEVRDQLKSFNLNSDKAKSIITLVLSEGDVEVDEDGEVTGVREALRKIAKDNPEWVVANNRRTKQDGNNKDDTSGGSPSGKQTNGRRRSKDGLDRATLETKFPALRR